MMKNSRYVGGYSGLDQKISWFWQIVNDMSVEEQVRGGEGGGGEGSERIILKITFIFVGWRRDCF